MVLDRVLCFNGGRDNLPFGEGFLDWGWYNPVLHDGPMGRNCAIYAQNFQEKKWGRLIQYFGNRQNQKLKIPPKQTSFIADQTALRMRNA